MNRYSLSFTFHSFQTPKICTEIKGEGNKFAMVGLAYQKLTHYTISSLLKHFSVNSIGPVELYSDMQWKKKLYVR